MKKLLLASTALVATAGVAQADIALTGGAEMGIFDNGNDDTQFFTDLELRFTFSGEADNGLSFGATIDLDEANANGVHENPALQGGEAIFVSFGGATLTMGDTDGALDARSPEAKVGGASSLADDETIHLGYNPDDGYAIFGGGGLAIDGAGDGQVARFDYTVGGLILSASVEQYSDGNDNTNNFDFDLFGGLVEGNRGGINGNLGSAINVVDGNADVGEVFGVGASYATSFGGADLLLGAGYQTSENLASTASIGANMTFSNGFSAGLSFAQTQIDDTLESAIETALVTGIGGGAVRPSIDTTISHFGVGVGYEMNALAIGLNYGRYESDEIEVDGYGLAVAYDLGGGLSLNAGYGYSDADIDFTTADYDDDFDTFSLGARMSF
ncbi:outer membrane protein OmpU [Roseivivax halotolerans]|uniref:Outer membrane protein OmpU n=1 Tax=Roseivivax halotolerans TaxID=93684 RepID=A0A1I5UXB5_9RHOB|nr:porin [Roseivivax halotolerans]SFP99870.1 outer membrane protein OmpU [Roseivivax halotolerans]